MVKILVRNFINIIYSHIQEEMETLGVAIGEAMLHECNCNTHISLL